MCLSAASLYWPVHGECIARIAGSDVSLGHALYSPTFDCWIVYWVSIGHGLLSDFSASALDQFLLGKGSQGFCRWSLNCSDDMYCNLSVHFQ